MKVWIAIKNFSYGGDEILGVFSQMKDAIDMAKACEDNKGETEVKDYEVRE